MFGFSRVPPRPIHLLDLHGIHDQTIPLNSTQDGAAVSMDNFLYTPSHELFSGFIQKNECKGHATHWPTNYDGRGGLFCVELGLCLHKTIRCSWDGDHALPGDPMYSQDHELFG